MNKELLTDTFSRLFADSKGLFAVDESNPTCNNLNAMQVDKLMFLFARGSASGYEYVAWRRKNN